MSFKRFDPEDIVLSSELITFPTWFKAGTGDTDTISGEDVTTSPTQGPSEEFYKDFYNIKSGSEEEEEKFDATQSKGMFSVAYATRPNSQREDGTSSFVPGGDYTPLPSEIVFGQFRSLILGDEDSEFRFGGGRLGSSEDLEGANSFFALTVDRARFREKLDPNTCRIKFGDLVIGPNITEAERFLDAGRVYELASITEDETTGEITFDYPDDRSSYGYFLPDVGVILFNADVEPFNSMATGPSDVLDESGEVIFVRNISEFKLRSQETVTSNYIFARARNAEFNYSTNPSNISGSAGNIRWATMINQPQSFITTVGLYNDSNELLAVAKLSKPLIKDFTKEALIRIKLDY